MRMTAGGMKRRDAIAGSLAMALLLGCASIPRYVRGDLRSRGYAPIPAGASCSLLPSLVPRAVDQAIAGQIVRSLEHAGHRMVAPERADVLIGYQQSGDGVRHAPTAFEASWSEHQALECPERFSQRLTIIATGSEEGVPAAVLWLAELCSDGGGLESSVHAGAFARELMKSFGANRAERRFEFLLPSSTQARYAADPPSLAPTAEPKTPTPKTPDEHPALAQPAPMTTPTADRADELVEPGPTWSDAKDTCASLDLRPDVGCALVVIAASGTPVLELGYPTRAAALERWKHDVAEAGAVFCRTAARHGVFELATVHIFAPDQRAERSCRALEQ
ncbi:MAG: hypothetical protein VX681_17880 [Myxococcota bacterium]|nr:hypothetical protein [Myxococcota bacterium]